MVNKVKLIEWIVNFVWEKEIDGIIDVNDEIDWEGMWIVIDVCCDVSVEVILNNFYKMILM